MVVRYSGNLIVASIDAKRWRIVSRFGLIGSKGDEFWVGPGDVTDFASVPWWTQTILPRTGTWTKAAVFHDKMCDLLNEHHKLLNGYQALLNVGVRTDVLEVPEEPVFNSVDTDALFRKNARLDGTDPIRSELLWFGVRCGALANPARREGWWSTFPRWFADLSFIIATLTLVYFVLHAIF